RRDERRGMVCDLAILREHRRDQQVFRARIGRALINVEFLLPLLRGGHGERRFADAGPANEPGCERQIVVADHNPASQELPQNLALATALGLGLMTMPQLALDAVDVHFALHVPSESTCHPTLRHLWLQGTRFWPQG